MGHTPIRFRKKRCLRPSDREHLARHCDRCGLRATREPLYAVADDLFCAWWRFFNGEDEYGRLLHGPGTRFLKQQDAA